VAKVVIVNPPQLYLITQFASFIVPPLGVGYLAAHARNRGHHVEVIDAFGERMDKFTRKGDINLKGLTLDEILDRIPSDADVIGISNLFSHAYPTVRDLARKIRKRYPDVPLLTGGIHPTALPEYVMNDSCFDFIVLGEGEITTVELIDRLESGRNYEDLDGLVFRKNGKIVENEKMELIKNLDQLPFPAWDLLPMRGRFLPILPTRGCAFKCKFCTAPRMWKPIWRTRSPENVVDEMEYFNKKLGVTDYHFEDLTSVSNKIWILGLCDEIDKRGLKITWQLPNGTRSESIDANIIERMKNSGCTNITFAPESGSMEALELMDKRLNLKNILKSSRLAVKEGMVVSAFFVFGVPGENRKSLKESLKLLRQLAWVGLHEVSITTFTLLPGSEFFYRFIEEKKVELNDELFRDCLRMSDLLSARSWLDGISDKELNRYRNWGFFQFFFLSYLFRPWRLFKGLWNVMRDKQETKVEKLAHEKLIDAGRMARKLIWKREEVIT
jgi:radical SAM superfamily enzyme YgiQ (UPF0313 family)